MVFRVFKEFLQHVIHSGCAMASREGVVQFVDRVKKALMLTIENRDVDAIAFVPTDGFLSSSQAHIFRFPPHNPM